MHAQRGAPTSIGVDTGGTFTDVFAADGRVFKLPSSPTNPADAMLAGLQALGMAPGDEVAHGTTVATNAVLERKGAVTALITTAGFEDVLAIRRQNRPSLYDLFARWPEPLVPRERRFGAGERLDYRGQVLRGLDAGEIGELSDRVAGSGAESIAICLLHAYVDSVHEDSIAQALRARLGNTIALSLSSQVAPRYGEFERTSTVVLNAYVMPLMRRYLETLSAEMASLGLADLYVMHSNGGLLDVPTAARLPVQTVLSGPAAGVVGARAIASQAGETDIITFDMGGTSTDVAVVPGRILDSQEGEVAGFPLLVPMLNIETVGAGGGSIARVDRGGGLRVGPESAGADPGPAAYGKGNAADAKPTVTDANLVLGRLSPRGLLGGTLSLDIDRARTAIGELARQLGLSLEATAWSIVRLANSSMERAVRTVTLQRGYDPRRFTLFPFGGAGPLHAAELAAELGIEQVLVPPHPGVMAALGLTIPDLQRDFYRTVLVPVGDKASPALETAFAGLEARARRELREKAGFGPLSMQRAVDMRYAGQSFDLRIDFDPDPAALAAKFERAYEQRYGSMGPTGQVEVVNARLQAALPRLDPPAIIPAWRPGSQPAGSRDVWFGSSAGIEGLESVSTVVLWRPGLVRGHRVTGPAVIEQYDSVTLVPPAWNALVDESFNLVLRRCSV